MRKYNPSKVGITITKAQMWKSEERFSIFPMLSIVDLVNSKAEIWSSASLIPKPDPFQIYQTYFTTWSKIQGVFIRMNKKLLKKYS